MHVSHLSAHAWSKLTRSSEQKARDRGGQLTVDMLVVVSMSVLVLCLSPQQQQAFLTGSSESLEICRLGVGLLYHQCQTQGARQDGTASVLRPSSGGQGGGEYP